MEPPEPHANPIRRMGMFPAAYRTTVQSRHCFSATASCAASQQRWLFTAIPKPSSSICPDSSSSSAGRSSSSRVLFTPSAALSKGVWEQIAAIPCCTNPYTGWVGVNCRRGSKITGWWARSRSQCFRAASSTASEEMSRVSSIPCTSCSILPTSRPELSHRS